MSIGRGFRLALWLVVTSIATVGCSPMSRPPVATPIATPVATPVARWLGAFFYDPQAHQVFMYGGQALTLATRPLSDIWTWDGRSWMFVPPSSDGQLPTARARELIAYDPDHKRILLFGGTDGQKAFDFLSEVWSWAGGQWSRLPDAPIVATSDGGAMAYDPSRHELVVVTMPPTFHWTVDDPNAFSLDTWLRNDQGWRQVRPQHRMPFAPVSMIFDSRSDRILASRETRNGTEIWSWDGQDWNLTADRLPGARAVLVDGGDLGILALDSTGLPGRPRPVYRLKGDQWIVAGPVTTGPSLALSPAYDQTRREMVSFSDSWQNGAAPLTTDDTWTWTLAAGWTKHPGRARTDLNATPSASLASPTPSPLPSASPSALAACVMPFVRQATPTPTPVAAVLPNQLVFTQVGSLGSKIVSATRGPDGAVWAISEVPGPDIGSAVLRFSPFEGGCQVLARPNDLLASITAGPDGNLWLRDVRYQTLLIDKLTVQGTLTEYPLATEPFTLVGGPDGAVWFTEESADRIGRITSSGTVTEYSLPATSLRMGCGGKCPDSITPGPDGALWFTEVQLSDPGNRIGRITLSGDIREFPPLPTPQTGPSGIAANGDSLWFGENRPYVGRITVAGTLTEYPLPSASVGWATVEVSGNGLTWFETGKQTDTGGITQLGAIALDGSYRLYPLPDPSTGVFVLVLPNGFIDVVGMNGKVWQAHAA